MKIEIAKMEKMAERGSSLMRLIQNHEMPTLDLFVRESIQNSLDAAIDQTQKVDICFRTGAFNRNVLMRNFEGIQESVERKFPKQICMLLEIKDFYTSGLTGPLHPSEVMGNDFGNLQKLIYQISMPQNRLGAGGSWGLGKTVYYRLGIGLVIYYSRIYVDSQERYESRMAACLVEDEELPDTIIPYKNTGPKRGIAWWGQGVVDGTTKPVTDEIEIRGILDALGTKPYSGDETGTAIIIPFLREDLIPSSVPVESEDTGICGPNVIPWWATNISDYIKVAIQRWYAPRMSPIYPHGSWLRASVNGETITPGNMLPAFQLIQALYNRVVNKDHTIINEDILNTCDDVHVKPIQTKGVFSKEANAGWISYAKVTSELMMENPPDNLLSPITHYLGKDEINDINPPAIMYTRRPGMIVSYEYFGRWTDGIPSTKQGEYIIGIFVANSSNTLKPEHGSLLLEEYLRKCEKADHASWSDLPLAGGKLSIVERIRKGVRNHVSDTFSQKALGSRVEQNIGLGRILADVLLPPEGFGFGQGRFSSTTGNGDKGGGSSRHGVASIRILNTPIFNTKGDVTVNFELVSRKNKNSLSLMLLVASEGTGIEADTWEADDNIGTKFPLRIKKIGFTKINTGKMGPPLRPNDFFIENSFMRKNDEFRDMKLKLKTSKKYGVPCSVDLILNEFAGSKFEGYITFASNDKTDKSVQGILVVESSVEGIKI